MQDQFGLLERGLLTKVPQELKEPNVPWQIQLADAAKHSEVGLPTICQAEFVTFFAPSALRAHNESGWHHNTYDDAAWPSGYAGVGRQ
jgi:hypothetical protein